MTTNVVISLEVVNHYDFPREAELLTQELGHMSSKLEDGPEYTDEEELLVHGFEGEYHTLDQSPQIDWVRETVADLAEDFPNLVIAMDVKCDFDTVNGTPVDDLVRREYFHDGKRQVAEPYMVVPDFDPDGAFEQP